MKIILVPKWCLPFGYGLCLYWFVIVVKGPYQAYLIAHEAEHVRQWKAEGFFKWPVKYFYYLFKYGYKENPYEVQARQAERRDYSKYA